MEPLIGDVEYHLHLGDGSLKWSSCSEVGDELLLKAGQKRPRSPWEHAKSKEGFYFVTDQISQHYEGFQLILPQPLVQVALKSIILNRPVRLTSYIIVSQGDTSRIEVRLNGLSALEESYLNKSTYSNDNIHVTPLMTLNQVQKIEKIKKSTKFTIKVRVDAISPIITFDPSDPFVLIEGYDAENDPTLSSSIVLRSKSLLIHAGIVPGMDLILREVRIKRWQIPQMFQSNVLPTRLYNRAPTHVFVVEDPNQVQLLEYWNALSSMDLVQHFPFPSIPIPLTCIQGKIIQIHIVESKSNSNLGQIHYLILESELKEKMKLYLTYYPISPHICDGFHIGAIVRAMNIHELKSTNLRHMKNSVSSTYASFGTCLRSSLTIMAGRSEALFSIESQYFSQSYKSLLWSQIQKTYYEYEWLSNARKILSSCGATNKSIESTLESILTHLKEISPGHSWDARRNPYLEWFDHVCEFSSEHHEHFESNICPCNFHGDYNFYLPPVISLSSVKKACLDHTSRALHKYLVGDSIPKSSSRYLSVTDRAEIGWTASFYLEANELVSMIRGEVSYHSSRVLLGGLYVVNSSEQQHMLSDGKCSLSLSSFEDGESKNSKGNSNHNGSLLADNNDFVCIFFSYACISCIYLGKYSNKEHFTYSTDEYSRDVYHLPTIEGSKCLSTEGPSNIIQIGDHLFLASTIIQYATENIFISSDQTQTIRSNKKAKDDTFSLRDPDTTDGYEICRLIRQRWKVQKLKTSFLGCTLTVGALPRTSENRKTCHLPACVDITLNIPLGDKNIKNHFQVMQVSVPLEILQLAFAWQFVAESRLCAIVLGGWDEKLRRHKFEPNDEHLIYVPISKVQAVSTVSFDVSNFYTRTVKYCSLTWVAAENKLGILPFTYLGGRNMYPGGIDLSIHRRIVSRKGSCVRYGEAMIPREYIYGLTDVSISQLQFDRVNDDCKKNHELFKIPNAHISVIRFCRARAECSRCYSALISAGMNKRKSFCDVPLEMTPAGRFSSQLETAHRNLACPSGCSSRYKYIKWELSANLSDGTCSTRIFTERDTSILLLGQGLDFDAIEAGAWESPDGIQYQIGSKLSLELKLDLARANYQISRHQLDVTPETLLTTVNRAQYLLHNHCSNTQEISRRMDFVCRVKKNRSTSMHPRSHDIVVLSSVGEEDVVQSGVDSNFLPTCDFVLVDCFRSYENVCDYTRKILKSLKES